MFFVGLAGLQLAPQIVEGLFSAQGFRQDEWSLDACVSSDLCAMSLDAGLGDWRSAEEEGGTGTYDIKKLLQQLKSAHERPSQEQTVKSEAEAPQEAGSGGGCDDLDAGLDEWRAAEEKMREKSLRESIARERELEKHVASLVAIQISLWPLNAQLQN